MAKEFLQDRREVINDLKAVIKSELSVDDLNNTIIELEADKAKITKQMSLIIDMILNQDLKTFLPIQRIWINQEIQ